MNPHYSGIQESSHTHPVSRFPSDERIRPARRKQRFETDQAESIEIATAVNHLAGGGNNTNAAATFLGDRQVDTSALFSTVAIHHRVYQPVTVRASCGPSKRYRWGVDGGG